MREGYFQYLYKSKMYISNQRSALLECWGCGGSLSFRAGSGEHIDVCIIEMICHYYSSSLVCSYRVINVNIIITTYCTQACKKYIHYFLLITWFLQQKKMLYRQVWLQETKQNIAIASKLSNLRYSASVNFLHSEDNELIQVFECSHLNIYCDNSVHENLHCNNLHNC